MKIELPQNWKDIAGLSESVGKLSDKNQKLIDNVISTAKALGSATAKNNKADIMMAERRLTKFKTNLEASIIELQNKI